MKETLKLLRFKHCQMLGSAKTIRDIVLSFPNLTDYSFDFTKGEGSIEIINKKQFHVLTTLCVV